MTDDAYMKFVDLAVSSSKHYVYHMTSFQESLNYGVEIRNIYTQYPILPIAVSLFTQMASNREWIISGKKDLVYHYWDILHNSTTIDTQTGRVYQGFNDFLYRLSLDYCTVGQVDFHVNLFDPVNPYLEYLDPDNLVYRYMPKYNNGYQHPQPTINPDIFNIKDDELVWEYMDTRLPVQNVFTWTPFPVGTNAFYSPTMLAIPTVEILRLVQIYQHNTLDGTRIPEVILVNGANVHSAIEDALKIAANIASGSSIAQAGVPVVEINSLQSRPVEELVGKLGISEIPDNFDYRAFEFFVVNVIASSLGLALRHFWNSESTTNRALEEIQERRQLQKGPTVFVREMQNRINRILPMLAPPNSMLDILGARFEFIEEVDVQHRLLNAQALSTYAAAFATIVDNLPDEAQLKPDEYLLWLQQMGVLPNSFSLVDGYVRQDTTGAASMMDTIESIANSSPEEKSVSLNEGEVILSSDGEIVDKRVATYGINGLK